MKEVDFPNLEGFHQYFSNRMEANERARFRYLASLGSAITAASFLIWQTLSLLESAPSFWNLAAVLSLVVLVYLMVRYTDSLFPTGIEGLLQEATEPGSTNLDERLKWLFVLENRQQFREDFTLSQIKVMLISGGPLLALFLLTTPDSGQVGWLALLLGLFRLGLGFFWVGLFLWAIKPRVVDLYLESLETAERLIERSPRLLPLAFKLLNLQRVVGALGKTIFYGLQIAAVFVLVLFFGGESWIALRLALLLLGLSFLGWFAVYIWKQIARLQAETAVWRDLRWDILYGHLGTLEEVRLAAIERLEDDVRARTLPYSIPRVVMDEIMRLPSKIARTEE